MTKKEQNVQDLVFESSKSAVDYLQVLYSIDGFESAKDEFKLVKGFVRVNISHNRSLAFRTI